METENTGKSVRSELLSLGKGLNSEHIAQRTLKYLQDWAGPEASGAIMRWDSRRINLIAAFQGQGQTVDLQALAVNFAKIVSSPVILPQAGSQAEYATQLPSSCGLAFYPLSNNAPQRIGLLLVGPTAIFGSPLLDNLNDLATIAGDSLSNAAEHNRVLGELAMLETVKETWKRLWREVEDQQKAIERLLARNQAIYDIGLAINSSLNLREVLTTIVSEAVKLLQTSRGAIALWNSETHDLKIMAEHSLSDPRPAFTEIDLDASDDGKTPAQEVRLPELTFPEGLSEQATARLRRFLVESWNFKSGRPGATVVAPVRWQRTTVGIIILNDDRPDRQFSKEDQDLLALIASQAAVAIENARLFNNITDERNRTSAILKSIADGVFTTDLEQRITSFNPAAEIITGCHEGQLLGQVYVAGLRMFDRQGQPLRPESSPCYQAIKFETSTEPRVFQLSQDEANPILIALVAAPIIDNNGTITGTVGVFRDVTREQEVSRLKDEFVSLVSHELRTPMASVLGFSELMLTRKLTEQKSRMYIETIHKEAQRLSNLIGDFLDIQRMEAGRQIYNYTNVRLDELLRPVLDIFATDSSRIKVKLPANLSPIWVDPDRIVQTLTNLISNAIKYSPDGGNVTISAKVNRDGMVEIAVKDEGLGIPKEAQSQLFGKFFRVDNSDRREIGGTGLGLAISREIVESHGGKIWVESEVGVGSTFYFTVPTAKASSEADEQNKPGGDSLSSSEVVLIVEDDESLGRLVGTYLEEDGYQYRLIPSAEQALRFLEHSRPLSIVLDIALAGRMDGWDLLINIKNNPATRDIPIVISTVQDNKVSGVTLGAAEFLSKPVDIRRLLEIINRLTALRPQRNILVIDDDASLRRMLKETLTTLDFVVQTAAGGEQGLKLAAQVPPDLIVLDLMMPRMDGFQVLNKLRNDRRTLNIPVVIVSAKELSQEESSYLKQGLAYFLTKSEYTPQRIRELVSESVQQAR